MKPGLQAYEAHAYDPDLGNEVLSGWVTADRENLRFSSGDTVLDIPISRVGLRVEEGRVFFSDPGRPGINVFTVDESVLECHAFQQSYRLRTHIRKTLGRRDMSQRMRMILYAAVTVAVLGWLGSILMGWAVRKAVAGIPVEWETRLGEKVMEEVRDDFRLLNDSNRVAQLTAMAAPLMEAINRDGKTQFRFYIVDMVDPNAFALPGGHVLVTTGLLDASDRPEELLGVIAHEVAHVRERHGFRQIISGAGPLILLEVVFGNQSGLLGVLLESSGMLIYQTHSQQHEREADETGWDYLVAANIDPRGMIEMLRKLKQWEDRDPTDNRADAFSSHPALPRRIAWLEERWQALPQKTGFLTITNRVPSSSRRIN